MQKIFFSFFFPLLCSHFAAAQTAGKRPLQPADVYRFQTLVDPQVSPKGEWVAYVLGSVDSVKDKRNEDIWMISWDGRQSVQLTNSADDESHPRWSPDGKYLSFLSSRQSTKGKQLWLLDRRGGEGRKLTDVSGELTDYAWSPDSKRLVLVIQDPAHADTGNEKKTKPPYVIDRYHFKQDGEGYLEHRTTHLYLFDVMTKQMDTLTQGRYNEASPAWSPDGSQIVFVSNRTPDPDKNENTDLYLMDAMPGAVMKQLTTWKGADHTPVWSPDGKYIAYLRSTAATDFIMYDQPILAIISPHGGEPRLLSQSLDRPVTKPHWSSDGQFIAVLVVDDRQRYVAQYQVSSGQITKLMGGERSFSDLMNHPGGNWLTLMSEPQLPAELYALENGQLRRLTHHQDAFVAPLALASVKGFTSRSKDGTLVSGLLFCPEHASTDQQLPMILYIHGGPVGQDEYGFDFTRQLLAAGGYVVAGVNYRGSSGRGLAYCKAIYADWGHKEVMDLLGAVDAVVQSGLVDSQRIGIAGWSYGGILTDYAIASDTRFKAACSGAGSALQLSMYGTDQYVNQYEHELGPPWKSLDKWLKLSYPFLKADRIKTPVLFMGGEKDFNVPVAGSEQMYQALRSLGIPAELVIYPGQFHGISVPSYQIDRFQRYLDWFGNYLKPSVVFQNSKSASDSTQELVR